jgi:uncharacterized membrane protein YhhN
MTRDLAAVATAVAVGLLLLAEYRRSRAGVWVAKPAASVGFIAVACLGSAWGTTFGNAVLVALALCAFGDVVLIPTSNTAWFLLGIGSFALGHLAYAVGFIAAGTALVASAVAFVLMGGVVAFTLRWLHPHLPLDMRVPVRVYMLVIAVMVAAAVGTTVATGDWRIAAGAIAFAVSDLSVARERFVRPSFANLLWGLPLYYAAQVLLAFTSGD